MEKQINLKAIYSNLIAGRLPVGSGSPQRVVVNQAYALLGTNRLHTYYVERAGFVYYFAIESQFLSSMPDFSLPFIDVLPGGPLHQGDAIYLLNGSDFSAALVLESGSLRLLCNDAEAIKDYLIDLDLQVIEIDSRGGQTLGKFASSHSRHFRENQLVFDERLNWYSGSFLTQFRGCSGKRCGVKPQQRNSTECPGS